MKIILGGDTHGDRNHVRWLLDKAQRREADGVLVLGDFGVWDHSDGGAFTKGVAADAERCGMPLWFLPGNHENYDLLEEWERDNPRHEDGSVLVHGSAYLRYSPRGHRWEWEGWKFLSLGGAYSVDKDWRIEADLNGLYQIEERQSRGHKLTSKQEYLKKTGRSLWWPQEEITEEEAKSAAKGGVVDIMFAHDKPMDAELAWNRKDFPETHANQIYLQKVVDATKPRLYLHGHFHYAYSDHLLRTNTTVVGLDCEPDGSRSSGGSGDRKQSWALLELEPSMATLSVQDHGGTMRKTFFPSDR